MAVAQLFDDALAHDVVGEAGEGLGADDIGHALVDELEHLAGEEPALAGLVADGDDVCGGFGGVLDVAGGLEVLAGD